AGRASLRRVRGRDLLDPTTSLVLQSRSEQSPTTPTDAAIQTAFLCHPLAGLLDAAARTAGHRRHVEGFDADRVEAPRDVSAGLFDPVLAPVGLTRFEFGDGEFRASSPVGTAFGAGQVLLQDRQPLGLT